MITAHHWRQIGRVSLLHSSRRGDEFDKAAGFEARATDQAAVDVFLREQLGRVGGLQREGILDALREPRSFGAMTATAVLEFKQRISKLSEAERREVSAFILRIKHESPAWKKETSRRMKEMDRGKKVRLTDLAKRLGHA